MKEATVGQKTGATIDSAVNATETVAVSASETVTTAATSVKIKAEKNIELLALKAHLQAIELARTVDAEVVPCEFEDRPAVNNLPDGASCELAYVDAGDLRLRFTISPNGAATNATWVQRLTKELQLDSIVGKKMRLVRLVEF